MLKYFLSLLTVVLFVNNSSAQELNCTVEVNSSQIQISNKRIFTTLQTAITQFMNERKWTDDNFKQEEKIQCGILINVQEYSAPSTFKGSIQISYSRPVYNSGYSSTVLNIQDKDFNFSYTENSPIEFTTNTYRSNLGSVLAYYAYLLIGMDYDTFAPEGGDSPLSEAQRVLNNAQNGGESGWKPYESTQNRYWIIDNLLQQPFAPLRACMYKYHREGLDKMYDDPVAARQTILEALRMLEEVHELKPQSYNMQLFFLAKNTELINIFTPAEKAEKDEVLAIVKKLSPATVEKYKALK
jgi:hypothetical protein